MNTKVTGRDKDIANEIWKQMRAFDLMLVWAMGTQKPTIIPRGLKFHVNGLKFKGDVSVVLNGGDLYDVSLNDTHGTKTVNDVYFDELMPLLGREVEGDK